MIRLAIKLLRAAWTLFNLLLAVLVSRVVLLVARREPIWLVCERCDEARDNGYHFFRYMRTQHPDKKVFYVISKGAADYARVSCLGNVIEWGSFRHYLYWYMAECIVSAHSRKCPPSPYIHKIANLVGLTTPASVFLQHGVTAIQFPITVDARFERHQLISVSSEDEKKFMAETAGHGHEVVQVLGLCRFDALHEPMETKRQILFMPTWRRWLRLLPDAPLEQAVEVFRQSAYLRVWSSIIKSEVLYNILSESDYYVVFYPHYQMQPYLKLFEPTHDRIILADRTRYDVQTLLKESAILVTDFSSVSFDFAYMKKPVVYLVPDEDRFFAEHNSRGCFDLERDGFGPVVREAADLMEVLEYLIDNNCAMDAVFEKRVDAFFAMRDDKNCERTKIAIEKMLRGLDDTAEVSLRGGLH